MYGRKLRTKLDILWPGENLKERVTQKQEKQIKNHSRNPRKTNLDKNSPVMARNYGRGNKWLPGTVERKTGPLSFKVRLKSGNLIKRHQDQLHNRGIPDVSLPEARGDLVSEDTPSQDTRQIQPPQSSLQGNPALLRRSSRQKKPVERLDL